jgi:V/A-type H+/Na+-transporting ATPase subunit K
MDQLTYTIAQLGPIIVLSMGCCGSAFGCYIASMASTAAMARTEEGHGKFIGMASVPSSQSIYGFILMILMYNNIKAGILSPVAAIFVGLGVGLALMVSAILMGKVIASSIQATLQQPSIYGKCYVAIGILESFALFAFVFALLIIGG